MLFVGKSSLPTELPQLAARADLVERTGSIVQSGPRRVRIAMGTLSFDHSPWHGRGILEAVRCLSTARHRADRWHYRGSPGHLVSRSARRGCCASKWRRIGASIRPTAGIPTCSDHSSRSWSMRRPSEIYAAISTRMSWSSSSLAIWRLSMLARSAPRTGSARL